MRVFDPWVGNKYWSVGFASVRILILGESHYGDIGTESTAFTTKVVREYAQEKRSRFFTITQKLVAGISPDDWVSDEERAAFWEQVAFYNFVQAFPGSEPRCRPTQEMWSAATAAFFRTLAELKPQVVVVLGFELQANLPEVPSGIHVCFARHPSSWGFQYEQWQPAIQAAIKAAAMGGGAQQGAPADRPPLRGRPAAELVRWKTLATSAQDSLG